jgi:hypothetical protein
MSEWSVRPRGGGVRLDLEANPLQVLVWMLLLVLVSLKITLPPYVQVGIVNVNIPPPWTWPNVSGWEVVLWMAAIMLAVAGAWIFEGACRRFCRALRFGDGDAADFSGRGDQALGWWILWVLAGRDWSFRGGERVVLGGALYLLGIWATVNVMRWFAAHVELSSGRRFAFQGTFRELLGWHILMVLSIVTIVGWAWVAAAFYRWAAENTRAKDAVLVFHGAGPEVLWRTLAAILFCCPIVTIPWAWLWYTRWLVRSVTMEPRP